MRLLLAFLLLLAPTPGTTIQGDHVPDGVLFTVQTDAPRSFYAQIDVDGGASVDGPTIFLFSLNAGESFAKTIHAIPGVVPGGVTMRVWTSDNAPVIALRVAIPARAGVQHVYVPFALH